MAPATKMLCSKCLLLSQEQRGPKIACSSLGSKAKPYTCLQATLFVATFLAIGSEAYTTGSGSKAEKAAVVCPQMRSRGSSHRPCGDDRMVPSLWRQTRKGRSRVGTTNLTWVGAVVPLPVAVPSY